MMEWVKKGHIYIVQKASNYRVTSRCLFARRLLVMTSRPVLFAVMRFNLVQQLNRNEQVT